MSFIDWRISPLFRSDFCNAFCSLALYSLSISLSTHGISEMRGASLSKVGQGLVSPFKLLNLFDQCDLFFGLGGVLFSNLVGFGSFNQQLQDFMLSRSISRAKPQPANGERHTCISSS